MPERIMGFATLVVERVNRLIGALQIQCNDATL